ncbi:MAG: hypothetical protein QOG44_389 [Acidimicrobiaceae bacterium]|nr:hypothetical protein [Acidimicrobiaceae bacterium]
MAAESVAEQLGSVDTKTLGPLLCLSGFLVVHPEAKHRHT